MPDEQQAVMYLPERLTTLLRELDRARLRWALLRPPSTLTDRDGDVDILVHPADMPAAADAVLAAGFIPVPMPRDLHAARYEPEQDRLIWLHLQSELRLGDASLAAAAILEGAIRDPLPRPPDAWLFWIVLLHDLLDKGHVPERHRPLLRRLAAGAIDAPPPLGEIAVERGLVAQDLLGHVAAGGWSQLPVPRPARASGWARRAWRAAAALSRPSARARRARGLTVAVIGPDGAGKTTLVAALRHALPFPSRVMYMGLTGGRLPRADALRVPGAVLAARLAILWARYAVGEYHRARGRIVLFDRYVLDGTVPSGIALGRLGRISRRVQARACPAPDLVLLLDARGATLHARSGEYDAATLESWRSAFLRLRASVASLEILDAEQPADAVRRQALACIWRCYEARWAERYRKR